MPDRIRIVAQFFNLVVLILGAWFAAQGAQLQSVLALLIGGFNLVVVTRVNIQAASRFFLLVPGTFGFAIGAINVGAAVGLLTQGDTQALWRLALPGACYALAGASTIGWLLMLPPPRRSDERPEEGDAEDEGDEDVEGGG